MRIPGPTAQATGEDTPAIDLEQFSVDDAQSLLLKSLGDMFAGFVEHLPNILIAAAVLVATWFVSWVLQRVYARLIAGRKLRRSLKDLLSKLITIVVWVLGLLAASVVAFPSVKPESILAGLGLSSIAIGFAFKDVVENFLAGFLILIREPLEIGDFIKCNDVEGKVEEISIRDTLIRQTDGQRVIMPNGMLFKNPVWIRTDEDYRRVIVMCGVAYDVDLDEARDVIRKAVESVESVHSGHDVQVFAQAFGASSMDFEVAWWTGSTPVEIRRSRDAVVAAIKRALDDAGMEIPFPQRTLWFKESLAVDSNANADQGDAP